MIQVSVSDELAQRLQHYQNRLTEVLEAGLRVVQSNADPVDAFWLALARSGRVILPTPASAPYVRQTPVTLNGQSLSDIVIAQRGDL